MNQTFFTFFFSKRGKKKITAFNQQHANCMNANREKSLTNIEFIFIVTIDMVALLAPMK